jgi:glycerol uptake facilitator-like aquaporin
MFAIAKKFAGHVIPGIIKPLRVLWNEMIGFFFLVLGVVFGVSAWRKYKEFDGDFASLLLLMMASLFVVLMLVYGISSFRRARRIGKS